MLLLSVGVPVAAQATTQTVSSWADLVTAFGAVGAGQTGTVVLDADIATTGNYLNVATNGAAGGASITLDLHGHSLNINADGANHAAIGVTLGASLTIEDTVGDGVLTATSDAGAGIGGWGMILVDAGTISILSGTVNATAHGPEAWATGIGAGYEGNVIGGIFISGGVVTAVGAVSAAGIGSAGWSSCGSGKFDLGPINISGGTVTATGGTGGAGIGSGVSTCSSPITISGGTVTAIGGERYQQDGGGAGIGTGSSASYAGNPALGSIVLSGGTVIARGGTGSAGIGAGYGGGSSIALPTLSIRGCVQIDATGGADGFAGSGAALGTGGVYRTAASIGTLTLPGTLTAGGATATGAGATVNTPADGGKAYRLSSTESAALYFNATSASGSFNASTGQASGGRFTLACQSEPFLPNTGTDTRATTTVALTATLALSLGVVLMTLARRRRTLLLRRNR